MCAMRASHPGALRGSQYWQGSHNKALINSGCTNCFMDLEWAKGVGLEPYPLQNSNTMYNVDGSQNREGKIQYGIDLLMVFGEH